MEDTASKQPYPPAYLGDAVYASFDGWHVQLTLNDHRNPPMIALEPPVLRALIAYARRAGLVV